MSNKLFLESIQIQSFPLGGIREITAGRWDGRVLDMSRECFCAHSKRLGLNFPGVYVIYADHFNKSEFGASLYIGQGDDVSERLSAHHKNKPYWNRVLIFASPKLDVAITFNVECEFIAEARYANRYDVVNGDKGQRKALTTQGLAYMNEFVAACKSVLALARIDIFTFNQDGKYFFKDRFADASIRLDPSVGTAIVLQGSKLWDYYIGSSHLESLTESGVVTVSEKIVTFTSDFIAEVDTSVILPRIFGKTLRLSLFKSNCQIGADKAHKINWNGVPTALAN